MILNNRNDLNKKLANKKSETSYDNSSVTQRSRLLKLFRERVRLTTFDIRHEGIMHPGGRILELRKSGNKIDLHWVYEPDHNGVEHRIGMYVFQREAKQ